MGTAILANRRRDRASSLEELAEEIGRKWGTGAPRLEIIQPGGIPGKVMALLMVFPREHTITENLLTRAPAELAWWQRDNHLLGFGLAGSVSEAGEQAIACADRGNLARRNLTVWFDRAWRKFRFFVRSKRGERYKPVGHEPTAAELRALVS